MQFIQKDGAKRYTLAVVYEPDVADTQGDFMEAPEIEKTAWNFMRKLQKGQAKLGDMHKLWDPALGDVVECFVAPADMTLNGQSVTKGTWLMGIQWSEAQWEAIQKGQRSGLSMGGRGRRIPQ